jgi:hypothetical protein
MVSTAKVIQNIIGGYEGNGIVASMLFRKK